VAAAGVILVFADSAHWALGLGGASETRGLMELSGRPGIRLSEAQ